MSIDDYYRNTGMYVCNLCQHLFSEKSRLHSHLISRHPLTKDLDKDGEPIDPSRWHPLSVHEKNKERNGAIEILKDLSSTQKVENDI